jgi:hypothetical protein
MNPKSIAELRRRLDARTATKSIAELRRRLELRIASRQGPPRELDPTSPYSTERHRCWSSPADLSADAMSDAHTALAAGDRATARKFLTIAGKAGRAVTHVDLTKQTAQLH